MTVLIVAVSLHRDPSRLIPVTTLAALVTTELTIALQEHAVENCSGLGGPSPIGARPFALTGHMDALGLPPVLKDPLATAAEVDVEFAT